ncbi:MAG TPA: hypothetical protein VF818_01335 [Ktedonobacterales bacterium]
MRTSTTTPSHGTSVEVWKGRRQRGWTLHHQGWWQKAIAAALGVRRVAVCRWLWRGRAGGTAKRPILRAYSLQYGYSV